MIKLKFLLIIIIVLILLIKSYKHCKTASQFMNNNNLIYNYNLKNNRIHLLDKSNIMNDLDYRVKWCMGIWYDTKFKINPNDNDLIKIPKKLNIITEFNKNKYTKTHFYINYFIPIFKIFKNNNYVYVESGDVTQCHKKPYITKSRPIDCNSNIIILLNIHRHWGNVKGIKKIDINFDNKKSVSIWRGTTTGSENRKGNRFDLINKWYGKNKMIDVGFSFICRNDEKDNMDVYLNKKNKYSNKVTGKMTIEQLLQYKYLISVEGNDVASGLKWMLYSNSLVLMPKPTVVSWFMEDHLVPYYHYIPIKDDWSDLLDQINWCEKNQDKCKEIIKNANDYVKRFLDEFEYGFAYKIHKTIADKYYKNIYIE